MIGAVKRWLALVVFWMQRTALFLRSWEYPMQLRLMEFFGQVIFSLVGVGPVEGLEDKEKREIAIAKGLLVVEEKEEAEISRSIRKRREIRRWLWDSIHSLIAKPARFVAHMGVVSNDVHVNEHFMIRIFRPSTARSRHLFSTPGFTTLRPVLFFHGGGFCLNSATTMTHHVFCERLAAEGFVLMSVDYRLAPEYPFPAGLTDCFDALVWLISGQAKPFLPASLDTNEIILAGDSAGGNFVAVLSSLIRDRLDVNLNATDMFDNLTVLHQVVAYAALFHQPLTQSMIDLLEGKQFPFLSKDAVQWFLEAYTGGDPETCVKDRRCAPMLAGCHQLPPTTVFTADDPLKDENVIYAQRLENAGVPCTLYHYESVHGYLTFDFLADSDKGMENLLDDLAPYTHSSPSSSSSVKIK